jgi:hypothetical protein
MFPSMIDPFRASSPALGATFTRTDPEPLPLTGANEIQPTSVVTVHGHPLSVETATSRVSPLATMVRRSGRSSNLQGAACCETATRLSLTTISPCRFEGKGLGATRNSTVLEPCPEVGDTPESQLAAVDTSQGHSGAVVIVTVPEPPSAPMVGEPTASATWHFCGVGAVVTDDSESPQPTIAPALRTATSGNE